MRKFAAKLQGLSPALDGTLVEAHEIYYREAPRLMGPEGEIGQGEALVEITRLGDMPVMADRLFVHPECLLELDDLDDEPGLGNPYGEFVSLTQWADSTGMLSCTVYESATHLNLRAESLVEDVVVWHADYPAEAPALLVDSLRAAGQSVVDLVFTLRELKKGVRT